jgi:hypothetical protein
MLTPGRDAISKSLMRSPTSLSKRGRAMNEEDSLKKTSDEVVNELIKTVVVADHAAVRDTATLSMGGTSGPPTGKIMLTVSGSEKPTTPSNYPAILLQATVVVFGDKTAEGQLIQEVSIPWFEIIRHLQRDPRFLYSIHWRQLEEIIAGAYQRAGYPEVILTPRSGDRGRDVIATKPGVGAIRIVG